MCNTTVKNTGCILDNLSSVDASEVTSVSYPSIGWPASRAFIHFVNCSHSDCSVFVTGKSCGQGTIMAEPHAEKAVSEEVFFCHLHSCYHLEISSLVTAASTGTASLNFCSVFVNHTH